MAFYSFRQNNSGGSFCLPAIWVVIEAKNVHEALYLAEAEGLYFNGCATGDDCPCCGDRWYEPWGEGDPVPMLYTTPVKEAVEEENRDSLSRRLYDGVPYAVVVYKNGTKEFYNLKGD